MYEAGRQNQKYSRESAGGATQRQGRAGQDQSQRDDDMDQQSQRDARDGGFSGAMQRGADQTMNMAELTMRGASALFDIQMAALQSIWQLQARSATVLGAPDCSDLLRSTQTSAQRLLATSAEQILTCARQTTQTVSEMQSQVGRIVEQGTQQLAEELRHGVQEMSQRTQDGLQTVRDIAQRTMQVQQGENGSHRQARSDDQQEENFGSAGEQSASEHKTGAQGKSAQESARGKRH
jgi:hypothetical protein